VNLFANAVADPGFDHKGLGRGRCQWVEGVRKIILSVYG